MTLVLFDIDGTLLKTAGAGLKAMADALHELHPGSSVNFDGISFNGRLDHIIWRDVCVAHGLDTSAEAHHRFRERYHHHLDQRLRTHNTSIALAGARELVERLTKRPEMTLGLLTGNYEHSGRLKVASAGFDLTPFVANAWADDGAARSDLPPVAVRRCAARTGRSVPFERVIIIGDTEQDVACAHAHGCPCLGTATGLVSRAELEASGAEWVVDDLRDAAAIEEWILRSHPQSRVSHGKG